jgi:hypothetical protein
MEAPPADELVRRVETVLPVSKLRVLARKFRILSEADSSQPHLELKESIIAEYS